MSDCCGNCSQGLTIPLSQMCSECLAFEALNRLAEWFAAYECDPAGERAQRAQAALLEVAREDQRRTRYVPAPPR